MPFEEHVYVLPAILLDVENLFKGNDGEINTLQRRYVSKCRRFLLLLRFFSTYRPVGDGLPDYRLTHTLPVPFVFLHPTDMPNPTGTMTAPCRASRSENVVECIRVLPADDDALGR
jgi:hypothetical protein